ncbi:hypothetical protein AO375_1975 [Moraxella catarrhalis]|nr:hypothetical protein AO375_1975 [Moraxella catarrhalis]
MRWYLLHDRTGRLEIQTQIRRLVDGLHDRTGRLEKCISPPIYRRITSRPHRSLRK